MPFVTASIERVLELTALTSPHRIIDVGSGPAVAACEFARRFPRAEVIAFDSSSAMLERASRRIATLGLGGRVTVALGELPDGLAPLGPAELIWASMSLHHVGDEAAALAALARSLAPGGVIVIAELADPTRVLPADVGVGPDGLTDRLEAAGAEWFGHMRNSLASPAESGDLAAMITSAGLTVLDDRIERLRFERPFTADQTAFVTSTLTRMRAQFADMLDAEDRAAIDVLLDPTDPLCIARRNDGFIDASRRILVATHPTP